MKYEVVHDCRMPKIGFGTWNIGGGSSADHRSDRTSLAALRSALELGYTHFDTAEMYAAGHCEELLGTAFREALVDRPSVFVATKVLPEHLAYADVLTSCEASLRRLRTDYVDLYLIHWPSTRKELPDAFRALNKLVADGKVRHVGVSNFSLALLKQAQRLCNTPILTNQVPYSMNDRTYAANGVLKYCQANNIVLTAYSPLDVGKLPLSKALAEVAAAHSATPYQVALAWLCNQRRVITIPMSRNPQHQRENLEAADIHLSADEMQRLA